MDDSSEINPMSPVSNQMHNGTMSPRENGMMVKKMEHNDRLGPHSPRSGTSSNASTPSNKKLEDKPSTPVAKSVTPTSGSNGMPPGAMMKGIVKPPVLNAGYPHYLGPLNGAPPPELAAAYGAAGMQGGLPPGIPAGYPRAPLPVGYDPHPQLRALGPSLGSLAGGKP